MTTAANAGIVVGMTFLILVILAVNVYILIYYSHPQDKNQSWNAKALIVFCLQLCSMSVLMLPLDVANNMGNPFCDTNAPSSSTFCGDINFYGVWQALFNMMGFTVVVLIPFAIFYYAVYELDVDKVGKVKGKKRNKGGECAQFCSALGYETIVILVFLIIVIATYETVAQTSVPVARNTVDFLDLLSDNSQNYLVASTQSSPYTYITQAMRAGDYTVIGLVQKDTTYISYNLDFAIYFTGLVGFCGFWIFSLFAGAGLSALPFDMVVSFIYRPMRLSAQEFQEREQELQDRTGELSEVTILMRKERIHFNQSNPTQNERRARVLADRIDINRLTQMVYILERDTEEFMACKKLKDDYSVLRPYFCLLLGVLLGLVSLVWLLHMVVYLLVQPSASLFLNSFLLWFNTWFPIFGLVAYGLFSLYLLFCTMKGIFKFGLRVMCFKILPVKVGGTTVDAFLFNLVLVLICTIPVIHFCTVAFGEYAVDSDVYLIFGVQIKYLKGFTVFYTNNVFTYFIFIAAFLTFGYLCYRPRDMAFSTDEFKAALLSREESEYVQGDIKAAFGIASKKSKRIKAAEEADLEAGGRESGAGKKGRKKGKPPADETPSEKKAKRSKSKGVPKEERKNNDTSPKRKKYSRKKRGDDDSAAL